MVTNTRLIARPRIGIAHPDASYRDGISTALGSHECHTWAPEDAAGARLVIDLAVVPDVDEATRVQRRWPRAALLSWGRPATGAWSWDGWIDDTLSALEVADLLLELLDTGLVGRTHGPALDKHNTKPQD